MTEVKLEGADFLPHEYGDGNANTIVSLIAGFAGSEAEFRPAVDALMANGHDVVAYEYSPDVFLAGDGNIIPALGEGILKDFTARAGDTLYQRHTGVSMGAGIAWMMQNKNPNTRPGLYAAAGTDAAKLVIESVRFRKLVKWTQKVDLKEQFENNGWDVESLQEAWKEYQTPPSTGFVLAVGGLRDYAIPHTEIMSKVRQWREDGIDFGLIQKPLKGHTGMKKWFIDNIPTMLAEPTELGKLRARIDDVDSEILALLQRRIQLVGRVAVIKARRGMEARQPERFRQLLARLDAEAARLGIEPELVDKVWSAIHDSMVDMQKSYMANDEATKDDV